MAGDACFRPEHRLHQAAEFSTVFSYRKVVRGAFFDLHWRPLAPEAVAATEDARETVDATPARLGLVVPKRLARRAVLRNRIKRLARETFRHRRDSLGGFDLVLKLGRKPLLPEDKSAWNAVLRQDIEGVVVRLVGLIARQTPR